jgi:enamine deaminase RidA (YjgF/YER057c/UK114 family)
MNDPPGKKTAAFGPQAWSRRDVTAAAATTVLAAGAGAPALAQTSTDRRMQMPDNVRFLNPDSMAKPPGYTHVVEVTGPGRTVYFAGQLGRSGKLVEGDFRAQTVQAFENLKLALASVGASFEHVVKLNNYLVDIKTNIPALREVRDRYINTASPPASTTVGVPQLARDGALFEVEAIAVLPPK